MPISSPKPNTTQTQNKPLPQPSYTKPTLNEPNSSLSAHLSALHQIQNHKHNPDTSKTTNTFSSFSQPSSPCHKHNLDSIILRFFIPSQTFSKSIHAWWLGSNLTHYSLVEKIMCLNTSSTKLAASTSVTLDHLFSVSEVFQVEDQLEYEDLWSDTTESEPTLPDSSKEIVAAHSKPTKND